MSEATVSQHPHLVLLKFLALGKRYIFEQGAEHGLTGMQTMLLCLLERPSPMNRYKQIFNCDASNITGLVDGLEQKQLVSRYESPKDRRIKMVRLEPAGKELRTALLRHFTASRSPLLSKLSHDEQQTFITLLGKITDGEEQV